MRILYVLSGTEIRGGATKSFLAMADSVEAAGHEVAVVVPNENGITPVLKSRGWRVVVVPYMFATLPYLSWSPRELVKFLPRLIKAKFANKKARKIVNHFAAQWRPDIVHDNTSVIDLGHYAACMLDVPHVIHIREYGWRDFRRIIPGLKKRLTAPNTYVATITSALASFRGEGIEDTHLRVIYNGVVNECPSKYNPHKEPFFLYAGRIRREKGVDDLVAAYVAYASSEIEKGNRPLSLKLAGDYEDGGIHEEINNIVTKTELEGYVEWLGEIEDVEALFSVAAATVIPSKSEGFGRVMPEAMAAGSLCVVRREGGLAEQLDNGLRECGREIAYGFETIQDLTSLLKGIDTLYRQGKEYEEGGRLYRMIDDSRRVVSHLYSYEANARGVLDYYSEILRTAKKK